MDERTRELIAIGASVSAHCQPCLEHHVRKARELGAEDADIREAVEVGGMVSDGASRTMAKCAELLLSQSEPGCGSCCAGGSGCQG
jgi:AhpD family alkylhydroperoxidase